ncbi:protein-disulfide reductase DsbD domain-containing protein [Magnetovibrio sp. PR-2]|uniref:protein-disulfide reductase DsbD family protein n=1 Tax=Magnetovibrio sp. PR-2 TaxID=3120356 RepID=UPI002FCE5A79
MIHVHRFFRPALVLLGTLLILSGEAFAATSDWIKTDHTELRIISQTDGAGEAKRLTFGLHYKLKPDWKIYWRSPGDAGFPPYVETDGSLNVTSTEILWPLPERFSVLGFETLGYKKEVVLPLAVEVDQPGEGLALNTQISYLACAEICIPYDAEITFQLPAGPATPSEEAHLINRYQSTVPGVGAGLGLELEALQFQRDPQNPEDQALLYVQASSAQAFTNPDAFIEGPEGLAYGEPSLTLSGDGKTALMEIEVKGLKYVKAPLDQGAFTVTLADAPRGAEFSATPAPLTQELAQLLKAQPEAAPAAGPSLLVMLALAVLGGLILNLMPCVLPVLSIKLLGVVGHGGSDTRTVRMSFLASAAGIITSFLVLAAALIVLKTAGLAIGWGIQFQHPWFLVAMALVVTLFACNLWGFFEVHLPEGVSELGAPTTHVHGLGSHFMTGALATLLATPCSAPFLGTAVGFALARGTFEILAIFAALGVGLALPYLLVALRPAFATKMPKPGRWMVILRRILGFALAGTGVWLVSILAIQVSQLAAALIGAILVVIAAMLFIHKRLHHRYGRMDWGAVAILSVLAFGVPDTISTSSEPASEPKLDALWTTFDQAAIREHVVAGRVVFVDVTAEWCITCQVNKAVVISDDIVYDRLTSSGTVAMQADWTRPSTVITNYLSSFGRYGIPFNAVYGPGAPGGIALPELLSTSEVISALDKAGSGAMAVGAKR